MSQVQFRYSSPFVTPKGIAVPFSTFYWSDGDYFLDNPLCKTPPVATSAPNSVKNNGWKPNEDKTKYIVEFECPGSTKEDITAELKDFMLTLTAKYKNLTKTKTIELPWDAVEEGIDVSVKNGILRAEVKVGEEAKQPLKLVVK